VDKSFSSKIEPSVNSQGFHLDPDQERFCQMPLGPIRLLAPAGCGKTQTLLWRCLRLAGQSQLDKPRFQLFTFTRAARDELRDRLRQNPVFAPILPLVSITTLNSWGFRFLKAKAHHIRLVTSSKDRYLCLHNILQPVWRQHPRLDALLTDSRRQIRGGEELMRLLDLMKSLGFRHDRLLSEEELDREVARLLHCGMKAHWAHLRKVLQDLELIDDANGPPGQLLDPFGAFWREATAHLYRADFLTLEDQKYWAWLELDRQLQEGRFTTGAARCHYLLVDEFQDINPLDLALLKAIAGVNKASLTIVGDDDQAIYEWRGATPTFIVDPDPHLGGTYATCILGTNYRSPRNIVELSQRLIAHNKRRVPKDVKPIKSEQAVVEIQPFPTLGQSIDFVVERVRHFLGDPGCRSIALVGRKRSQIIPYQIVFAGQDIPFYAAEDLHVLLSEAFNELKAILAIRSRVGQPAVFGHDAVSDLLTLCDKVKRFPLSKRDREPLHRHLRQAGPKTMKEAMLALLQYTGPLKGENAGGRRSMDFVAAATSILTARTVAETIQAVSSSLDGMQKDYGKSLEDIFYADPPFLYLAEYARRYGSDFASFYHDVEQAIATLARIPGDEEEDAGQEWKLPLHLMTALRAKGKEFDVVVVLDANDGIWPSRLALTDEEQEQERRLFYVAMTRARRYLYFLTSESVLGEPASPSPYLVEMGLIEAPRSSRPKGQLPLF